MPSPSLVVLAALAFPPAAEWTAHCRVGETTIELAFRSRSGEWDNDDMQGEARIRAAEPVRVAPPGSASPHRVRVRLERALSEPCGTLDNVPNRCDRGVGLDVGNGRLLVLV